MKTINWTVREYMESLLFADQGMPVIIDEDMLDLAHFMQLDFTDISNSGSKFLVNHFKGSLPDRVTCEEAILDLWGIGCSESKPALEKCFDHLWVGSGCPGGSAWCKICDTDYMEHKGGTWEK